MAEIREVRGLSQLLANMKQLPRELVSEKGGLVRNALFRSTKLVRDRARQLAPRDTGNLAKNIVAHRDPNPRATGASERFIVVVRKIRMTKARKARAVRTASGAIDYRASGDAFYWRFLEFGTRFIKAQPFLRPAFESQKNQCVDVFKDQLGTGIAGVVAKMHK